MAPVSRTGRPSSAAMASATVDLPAPDGPSIATTGCHADDAGEAGEVVGELGVGGGHGRPASHGRGPGQGVGGDRARHRDAVVAVALERRRGGGAAPDHEPVGSGLDPDPELRRALARGWRCRSLSFTRSSATSRNSVTPSANAAATARAGTSSIEPLVAVDDGAGQRRGAHAQVPDRLAEPVRAGLDVDAGAHAAQHVDEPEPGGVQGQLLEGELGSGGDGGGDHEEHAPTTGRRARRARTAAGRRPGPAP